ncbi:MAG: hypothetical protein H6746_03390 [Deltaproteobacteria bacterium]|nr:hypothetical protein [Deltaproteobacteria bacterium]
MKVAHRRLLTRLAGAALALIASNALTALPMALYCNLLYLQTIEVDLSIAFRTAVTPRGLIEFALGWLLLFISAFMLGARPGPGRHPRLALVVPLLCLLPVAQIGLQLFDEPPPSERGVDCTQEPARLHAGARFSVDARGAEPGYTVEVNALGMRGPERDPSRPAILLVGDSFMHGTALQQPDTIAASLERELPGYQVLNAGIEGDNLSGALERARAWLPIVQPVALVIGLYSNDGTHGSTTALCEVPACCRREVAWHLIDGIESRAALEAAPDTAWLRAMMQRSWDPLARALADRGIPTVVYVYRGPPPGLDLHWFQRDDAPVTVLQGTCSEPEHYFILGQTHPNATGTACMAGELAKALRPSLAPLAPGRLTPAPPPGGRP